MNKRKKRVWLTPGEVVRELRLKKNWSQQILSQITGIAVSNISNLERGISRIGDDRAILLAEALGVKPEFILFPNGFIREDLKEKIEKIRKNLKALQAA
jgi:transcriptional regulator with XRE-family HTH domain